MKKAKIAREKQEEQEIDKVEEYSLKNLLMIVLIVLTVFVIFYFITVLVVKPSKESNYNDSIVEIDSTKITLNHLLDRNSSEYYVLAIKQSLYDGYVNQLNYIEIYNKYISDYLSKENSLTVYRVDLDDALNKNYISTETNITDNISDLKLNDEVLFKIKDGKIEQSYIGNKEIIQALSEM